MAGFIYILSSLFMFSMKSNFSGNDYNFHVDVVNDKEGEENAKFNFTPILLFLSGNEMMNLIFIFPICISEKL